MPLCGNSIGTDRRFLAQYLPDIEDHLHYRSIDVSSLKELVRRWYPKVRQARPQKVGNHRALDDIRDSIEELRYYRERVFVPRGPTRRRGRRGADLMRAVVLDGYGGPEVLHLTEVDAPVPGPDEVLVDVHHGALNRADVLQRTGGYPDPSRASGEPRRRSPAWSTPGASPRSASGSPAGPSATRVMGIETGGCYAEQVVTHQRLAMPVPTASTWPTPRPCPRCSSPRGTRSSCRVA